MESQRRASIRKLASAVREHFDLTTPVDLESFVRTSLRGAIVERPLPGNVEAYICKSGADSFEIHIDPGFAEARKNFSIAHELGHLFMHLGFMTDEEKWNSFTDFEDSIKTRNNHYDKDEFEAHEFAASLLMPEDEFKVVSNNNKLDNNRYKLTPIANHFGVSVDAVRTRGRWLGLFSWD